MRRMHARSEIVAQVIPMVLIRTCPFPSPVVVASSSTQAAEPIDVLFEELYYNRFDESLALLCVSRPLCDLGSEPSPPASVPSQRPPPGESSQHSVAAASADDGRPGRARLRRDDGDGGGSGKREFHR